MNIDYDKEADALYIQFIKEPVKNTEEIEDGIIIDYSEDERVIGIEILNISKKAEIKQSIKELFQKDYALSVS